MFWIYAQFWIFRKGSGTSFSTTFCVWFSKKNVSHIIINWPSFYSDQVSLPDCLGMLRYWSICALQLFINHVVTSQILKLTLSFESSRFSTWPKSQGKNLKYLENKKSFSGEIKSIFSSFLTGFYFPHTWS